MPLRLFAPRCRRPTPKNYPKPSQAEFTTSHAHEWENTIQCQKDRANPELGNWARGLGVALSERCSASLVVDIAKSGMCNHLQMSSLFERIGAERPIQSDSYG
jgi:hypothetical protein